MSYSSIRIERERNGYEVSVTDPEIVAKNRKRDSGKGDSVGEWMDPNVSYSFKTKEQVLTFLGTAIDIALPADDYASAFDKLAEEAKGTKP